MTYSNSPTNSPYQHSSEFAQSNDYNQINPFVVGEMNLPGTWSDPYPYATYFLNRNQPSDIQCAVEPSCDTSKSPICETEITAGDRTIDMCRPTPPNLPMCRPLVPETLIDPGMWTYNQAAKAKAKAKAKEETSSKDTLMYILLALVIMIMFLRR